jgi:hypothetical protein
MKHLIAEFSVAFHVWKSVGWKKKVEEMAVVTWNDKHLSTLKYRNKNVCDLSFN